MPNHDEEPDKEFDDAFKMFTRMEELKKAINNSKGTKKERSLEEYNELLKNDNKSLEKMTLEAKSRVPSLSDGAPLTAVKNEGRPTYISEIQKVGKSLLGAGEINHATPWKRIADKVRTLVQEGAETSDSRGLDDQTIRRHLKTILDAHGKARGLRAQQLVLKPYQNPFDVLIL